VNRFDHFLLDNQWVRATGTSDIDVVNPATGQTVRREETMKHSAIRSRNLPELPIAWSEAEYAALRANAADTCDDRVSENIFDVEDERAEINIIVDRMINCAN
jgi:hypothetical protein